VEAPRSLALEAALFLLIVAAQLASFPQSRDAFLDAKIHRSRAARRLGTCLIGVADVRDVAPGLSYTLPDASRRPRNASAHYAASGSFPPAR
jgi:hypothetical protein